jgi:DNA-binding transcriptional regulator YiaG
MGQFLHPMSLHFVRLKKTVDSLARRCRICTMTTREVVRSYRMATGCPQTELAKRLGVSLRTVKVWEASSGKAPQLLVLAVQSLHRSAPEKITLGRNQAVPTQLRPKCQTCGSEMYTAGTPFKSQFGGREIQAFCCKKRDLRGRNGCSAPSWVPYFLDSVLAGRPEIAPLQRDWRRKARRELGFPREQVRCPIASCPRNHGKMFSGGMRVGWTEARAIAGYAQYGKLMKFVCTGSARHPHQMTRAYWSIKLAKVVEIPDPLLGKKKINWWEEQRGVRDSCPECGHTLRRQKIMKRGSMKGFVMKYCPNPTPHNHGKYYYFDPKTGARRKASVGRRGPDLPTEALKCDCGSDLKRKAPCFCHKHCYRLRCVSPAHQKDNGSREHHWDLRKRSFMALSRMKPIPGKLDRRNCPRCKKPMSWRKRGHRVYFSCPGCRHRYGRSWTISVGPNNDEIRRSVAKT